MIERQNIFNFSVETFLAFCIVLTDYFLPGMSEICGDTCNSVSSSARGTTVIVDTGKSPKGRII